MEFNTRYLIVAIHLNELAGEWWFDLGVSIGNSGWHEKKRVITIGLAVFSIYIRF